MQSFVIILSLKEEQKCVVHIFSAFSITYSLPFICQFVQNLSCFNPYIDSPNLYFFTRSLICNEDLPNLDHGIYIRMLLIKSCARKELSLLSDLLSEANINRIFFLRKDHLSSYMRNMF